MKKNNKILSMMLVFVLLVSVLSGCAKEEVSDKTEDGKTIITVANWPDPDADPNGNAEMEGFKKQFMEENPDIEINGKSWWYSLDTFMANAETDTLPTVYKVYVTELDKIINGGYAADLTDEIKEIGFYDKINEHMMKTISRDGRIYFFPSGIYSMGLVINMNLFRQAGLIDENGAPIAPKTFDELREISKIIHEKTGKAGFVFPTLNNGGGWNFTTLGWNYGVDFMEETTDGWKATFANEKSAAALKLLKDMKWEDNSLPSSANIPLGDLPKIIALDQAAMAFAHPGQIRSMTTTWGMKFEDIGFVKMPAGPERHVTLIGGEAYAIAPNATKDQIDAAIRWLKFRGINPDLSDEEKENYYNEMKQKAEVGDTPIGIFDLTAWDDTATATAYKKQVDEEFRNIPIQNVADYNDKTGVEIQGEEPVCAQELYAALDRCIQEVLTNKDADCLEVLKQAQEDFQSNHLDYQK